MYIQLEWKLTNHMHYQTKHCDYYRVNVALVNFEQVFSEELANKTFKSVLIL